MHVLTACPVKGPATGVFKKRRRGTSADAKQPGIRGAQAANATVEKLHSNHREAFCTRVADVVFESLVTEKTWPHG